MPPAVAWFLGKAARVIPLHTSAASGLHLRILLSALIHCHALSLLRPYFPPSTWRARPVTHRCAGILQYLTSYTLLALCHSQARKRYNQRYWTKDELMKEAHDSRLAKENIYGKKDLSGTNPQSWFDGWTGFRVSSGAGPLAQRPMQGICHAVAVSPAHARAQLHSYTPVRQVAAQGCNANPPCRRTAASQVTRLCAPPRT